MAKDKKSDFGVGEKENTGTPPGKMIGGILKKAIGAGKSMMGGGVQQIEVQGRLSGSDIWLSNSKTTNSRLRSV